MNRWYTILDILNGEWGLVDQYCIKPHIDEKVMESGITMIVINWYTIPGG